MGGSKETTAKSYLLAFDQETDRKATTELVEGCKDIFAWIIFSDSAAVICSDKSASELGAYIRERYPGKWFVITQAVPGNSDGWAPETIWMLIDDPENGWAKMAGLQLAGLQPEEPTE